MYNTKDFLNIRKVYGIIKNIKEIDVGTKNLILDFFKFNLGYIVESKKD